MPHIIILLRQLPNALLCLGMAWLASWVALVAIEGSAMVDRYDSSQLISLLLIAVGALSLMLICSRIWRGKWHWLFMPVLVPLLYYSIGNILYLH